MPLNLGFFPALFFQQNFSLPGTLDSALLDTSTLETVSSMTDFCLLLTVVTPSI